MRVAVIVALAFAGGLALAALATAPSRDADGLEAASLDLKHEMDAPRALPSSTVKSGLEAPRWYVGEAWRVGFGSGDPICWVVVAEETDEGFRQGISCPDDEGDYIASQLASFEQTYIGLMGPGLEGLGRGERVEWFSWPLVDGKTWRTEFGGQDAVVTSTYGDVRGPRGSEPGYKLVLTIDDEPVVDYDYVPSLRWWSHIHFAVSDYVFRVVEHDGAFSGTATYGEARLLYDQTHDVLGPPGAPSPTFTMGADDDVGFLYLDREGFRAHRIQIRDPSGNTVFDSSDALGSSGDNAFTLLDGQPGTWTVVDVGVSVGALRTMLFGVHLTSVEL